MKRIVIASAAQDQLAVFSKALADASGCSIIPTSGIEDTLDAVRHPDALIVIIDESIAADDGKALLQEILMINAMISSAVITDMPEEQFHDTMEGLGILMPLPQVPGQSFAGELWKRFREANEFLFDGDSLKQS